MAVEGYFHLYPLLLTELDCRQLINVQHVSYSPRVPPDTFLTVPVFPPADMRLVVRPVGTDPLRRRRRSGRQRAHRFATGTATT